MTLRVDVIETASGGPVELTKQSAAKAFMSFNGAAATIRDSLNTASITDNGTGDFTQNYTNNFASNTTTHAGSGSSTGAWVLAPTTLSTSSVQFGTYAPTIAADPTFGGITTHGDLA